MPSDTHDRGTTTRRGVLAGAAAAALLEAGRAGTAEAEAKSAGKSGKARGANVRKVDVVVVGGGLSGLSAADRVRASGRSVLVLEAQNRVGGRTETTQLAEGFYVEHGGVFIVSAQREHELLALTKRFGIGQLDTVPKGKHVYVRKGTRVEYSPNGPSGRVPTPGGAILDLARLNRALDPMIKTLPPDRPWEAPDAWEWDSQTFATFRDNNTLTDDGRWTIDIVTSAITGNEPRDLSLLGMMSLISGTEGMGIGELTNELGYHRFDGGAQGISLALARTLGKRRIVLNSPVRRIDQAHGGLHVVSDKMTVAAKQVIVAMPPFLSSRIIYDPPLPAQRAQLCQRYPNASIFRINVVYDEPFWYQDGLSGEVWTDLDPFRFCWDVTPPDHSTGILTAFINGAAGRRWTRASFEDRKAGMLAGLARGLGPRAAQPRHYFEKAWPFEEWTASCQYGVFPPGVLTEYADALRPSFDRIHWAGTEVAERWTGSMEGAVRAGYAAAERALNSL